jgi:DNA-directed RNA polymerase specialized sigma24 family protein
MLTGDGQQIRQGRFGMAASILNSERDRELLSQAIVHTLDSWPQLDRQIFAEVHYNGRTIEDVANFLGINDEKVRRILQDSETRLRRAVHAFSRETHAAVRFPPGYARSLCCH